MTDQNIRNIAESLIRSTSLDHDQLHCQIVQSSQDISHSHSINTIASVRPDYIAVRNPNEQHMSRVRRFFCLFVTFDLMFTSLLWIVIIMLKGEFIMKALEEQVVHYDIHTSLFDIVLLASSRFLILLLFYGVIRINHWIIIALSTTATCAFLIAKVLVYNWQGADQQVFRVLLVLISFVLSWGEAWFFDYKVIPQETRANQILIASPDDERTPLIRSYVNGLPSMCTESVANFYSPLESPEGSMHRFPLGLPPARQNDLNLPPQAKNALFVNDLISRAKTLLPEAWALVNSDQWKLSKKQSDVTVDYLVPHSKSKKIYRLTAIVNVPPEHLFDELYYGVENLARWNPTVLESKRIQILNDCTDVCYQISASGGGGTVSSRDFVSLRHWTRINGCYVIANVAVEHPAVPKVDKYTRGENGVGCFLMRPIDGNSQTCQFQWMLNTDLKGWLNMRLIEASLVNMMFEYVVLLRMRVESDKYLLVDLATDESYLNELQETMIAVDYNSDDSTHHVNDAVFNESNAFNSSNYERNALEKR